MNAAPAPGSLTTPDAPAVRLGDRRHDGQTEPGSRPLVGAVGVVHTASRRIRPIERLEDLGGFVGGEPGTAIAHLTSAQPSSTTAHEP